MNTEKLPIKYPLYDKEGIESVKPGLYLGLIHGFHTPEEREMTQDWGATGPLIGPLKFVHTTYFTHVRIEFENLEDAKKYGFSANDCMLDIDKENCLVFGDMQYGDWTVEYIKQEK